MEKSDKNQPSGERLHLYRQATVDDINNSSGGLPPLSTNDYTDDAFYEMDDDEILTTAFSQHISVTDEEMSEHSRGDTLQHDPELASHCPDTHSAGYGDNEGQTIETLPAVTVSKPNDVTEEKVENVEPDEEDDEEDKRFNEFTRASYDKLLVRELERKRQQETKKEARDEAHLVDGEIVFDDAEDESAKITKDPKLADGMPLPEKLGRFPRELDGLPLEEIDPHIQEKTFIIIAKKFKRNHIFRFSATHALFCLAPWNRLRKFCLSAISNQFFDFFILLTIAVNCVFMVIPPADVDCLMYKDNNNGFQSPSLLDFNLTEFDDNLLNCTKQAVDYVQVVPENIFLGIYTIEMILKICARGLILNKYTYLRDGWNWLDCVVVIIAYVLIIIEEVNKITNPSGDDNGGVSLTGIRTFRVLRALKSISVVPGLRTIVNALLKSMKMLGEVMLLTLFCLSVFALLALQLYMGTLKQKCVAHVPETFNFCNETNPNSLPGEPCYNSSETLWKWWLQTHTNYLQDDEGEYVLCNLGSTGADISGCPEGYFCAKAGDNPNWKYTHFDQFQWAMLNTFQLVSLDFWEDTYNKIIIVSGPWNILFFLMTVLLGSFYLLNLMLAVVFMAYTQEADVEAKLAKEQEEEERAKEKRKQNTALLFDPKKLKAQLLQRQQEENKKAEEQQAANAEQGEKTTTADDPTLQPNGRPFRPRITSSFSLPKFTNIPAQPVRPVTPAQDPIQETPATPLPTSLPTPSPEKKTPIKRPKTGHGQFVKSKVTPEDQVTDTEATQETADSGMKLTELEDSAENLKALTAPPVEKTEAEPEEESEDVFYDDLPPMDRKTERYLVQKFATLWLNRIRPGHSQNSHDLLAIYDYDQSDTLQAKITSKTKIQAQTPLGLRKRRHSGAAKQLDPSPDDGFIKDDKFIDRNCLCCAKSGLPSYHIWMKWQNMVFKVANDGLFELFITLCIAVNTAMMASEYYNPCELCRLCVDNFSNCTICPEPRCSLSDDSVRDWQEGMTKSHSLALDYANYVFTAIFTVEAIIKLTALSKEYFNVGWNVFDLVIVVFSLIDLVITNITFPPNMSGIEGIETVTKIIKVFRLLRIVKLAQAWSTMRILLGIIFGAFGALVNLSLILLIIMFIFAVLGNQLLGPQYKKYEDIVENPELADYGGELPRWHFVDFFHSLLMVFRILCGEWVEPLWDCMRVANEAGCSAIFLATLIIGNFMIFNLFLALLLNSFSTDKIKKDKGEEGPSKLKKSLRRIYHCFNSSSCCNKQEKSADEIEDTYDDKMDRLYPDMNERKPSIAINGSEKSALSLIEATSPHMRNGSAISVMDETKSSTDVSSYVSNGLELKPVMRNGHAKSRSASVLSNISNGTSTHSNGVLRNKSQEMSPYNLQQIESAFSTQRDQYAKFETAVNASHSPGRAPITPIIIAEDFSTDQRKSVYITEPEPDNEGPAGESDDEEDRSESEDEDDGKVKDEEDEMIAEDGHIILPDCCCLICHKNPKLDGCCCSTWLGFRMLCAKIVTHKVFEGFILILIGASTIALCFEDIYLHESPSLEEGLKYLNVAFATIFFIEMGLKMFALGAKKYFTGFWTILDFVIVAVSVLDVAGTVAPLPDISALRALRTLRALRPLRAVSRWESMTIIVNALIFAMPAIANVLLVCVVFWLLFGIMGVQTFRGRFHRCELDGEAVIPINNDTASCNTIPINATDLSGLANYTFRPTLTDCSHDIMAGLLGSNETQWHWAKLCMLMGGEWNRFSIHFDHLGAAYLALYQTATFEGWMEVMEYGVDHNPVLGGQPMRELSLYWYIYFMFFIIFGAFFTLNLFIGVIIDNFNVLKKKYDGSYLAMFLTDNQRHYYNTLKKLGNKKPQKTIRRPKTKVQGFFFDIAVNTRFEIGITFVIFLNMLTMMLDYEPATVYGEMSNDGHFVPNNGTINFDKEAYDKSLKYVNYIFTSVFVMEAAIKIVGLRWHYFRRAWNVFDFVIVFISVLSIILELLDSGIPLSPTLLRVVRVFRIGRVIRLVKAAKGIRKLLFALIISVPALFNIATLLFLFMFIFAIIGMMFFMNVRHKDALDETTNFETFGRSILLLFRLSTSAGWNDVLYPLIDESDCNRTHYTDSLGVPVQASQGDCPNQTLAVIFFVCYLFVSFMVIINMYIAVILENFNQANEMEEIGITDDDFDAFYVIWERFDPHATQYIKLEKLSDFISELDAPLGIQKPNSMAIVAFNLPIVENDRIHCLDILMALVKRVLHHSEDDNTKMSDEHKDASEKLKQQIAEKYKQAFPQRQNVKIMTTTMQRKKEDVAAKTLQRAWRKHKMKKNILRIKELALDATSQDERRPSGAFSSLREAIKERIGSAFSRISIRRRSSSRSIDSREGSSYTPRSRTPRV